MTEMEEIRTRLGWSQAEMGERLGVHRNTVRNLEQDSDTPVAYLQAARLIAMLEAARRADLNVLGSNDRKLVVRLCGLLIGDLGEVSMSVRTGPDGT